MPNHEQNGERNFKITLKVTLDTESLENVVFLFVRFLILFDQSSRSSFLSWYPVTLQKLKALGSSTDRETLESAPYSYSLTWIHLLRSGQAPLG